MAETLTDDEAAALRNWIREQGIGSEVSDLTLLAGGTQNIVVGMRVDGRRMVLRPASRHPRPNEQQDDAARDRGAAYAGRLDGAASRIRLRL